MVIYELHAPHLERQYVRRLTWVEDCPLVKALTRLLAKCLPWMMVAVCDTRLSHPNVNCSMRHDARGGNALDALVIHPTRMLIYYFNHRMLLRQTRCNHVVRQPRIRHVGYKRRVSSRRKGWLKVQRIDFAENMLTWKDR